MNKTDDKLSRFTKRSRTALKVAQKLAVADQQAMIHPQHLLRAILHVPGGDGVQTLAAVGIDPLQLRQHLKPTLPPGEIAPTKKPLLSPALKAVIAQAVQEAITAQVVYISTRHLVQALVALGDDPIAAFFEQQGVTVNTLRAATLPEVKKPTKTSSKRAPAWPSWHIGGISPIFWGLVLATIGAGYLSYTVGEAGAWALFLFVTGGWLVSVALHEFGHALVAYWGGDYSVVGKGYLTLNLLRYIDPVYSIILPVVFLLIGGVALPGAAVHINTRAIKGRAMQTFMSLAGILMNSILAVVLALPFLLGWHGATEEAHFVFWSGLALLVQLQLIAILLCLLPLPGFDGFFALKPYLPNKWVVSLEKYSTYSYLVLWFVLLRVDVVSSAYYFVVSTALQFLQIDWWLASNGWRFFRFWPMW